VREIKYLAEMPLPLAHFFTMVFDDTNLFSHVKDFFALSMHPEGYPPQKALSELLISHYLDVLSSCVTMQPYQEYQHLQLALVGQHCCNLKA